MVVDNELFSMAISFKLRNVSESLYFILFEQVNRSENIY